MEKEFIDKIVNVQSSLKAPKNQYNAFARYKYRSCEDILEAIKPLLHDNGLALIISDEIIPVANRIYVKATATVTDGTNSVSNAAFAREEETKKGQDASQITGAASSYARKYALNGLFCIDDTKDADTTQGAPDPSPKTKAKAAAPAAQPVNQETLNIALSEVRAAQSKDGLEEIFPRYAMLQQDNTFRNEYRKRMEYLKSQGLWN